MWQVITDFPKYPEWNPYIVEAKGSPIVGAKLEIHIQMPSGKDRRYKPVISILEEENEIRWVGKSTFPGLLNAEHIITIEREEGCVNLIHIENFRGFLTPFFARTIDSDIKEGLEKMDRALKRRAEQGE